MSNMKKDVILYFVAKVIVGIVGFLLMSFYSSRLAPDIYGEYSLISGLVLALISVFIGWIGSSALRYYVDYEDKKGDFFSNVIIYTLIMIFIMFIILFVSSFISNKIPLSKYLIPTFIYTFCYSFVDVFEKIIRSSQKSIIYAIGIIVQSILSIVLFLILSGVFNLQANAVFFSNSVSRFVFLAISLTSLGVLKYTKKISFNKEILKKFLKYGIPMIGVWGASWILSYCDRYVIAIFYNTQNVGIYDMSYKIAENSINIFITAFSLAIFPNLIRAWKDKGKKAVEEKITKVLHYYFMLIIPAIAGLSMISKNLYLGIIDKQYFSGYIIIIIVSIGMFFGGLNGILNKIWQLNEKTKNIFYIMVLSVILNIGLNILLIPHFGIVVAAVTTLISCMVSTIITYCLVRKEFAIKIDARGLFKTIISTIFMGVFLALFNLVVNNVYMLIIEIIIAISIYGISSIITKNVTLKELKVIRNE